jgi:hypothetical protein
VGPIAGCGRRRCATAAGRRTDVRAAACDRCRHRAVSANAPPATPITVTVKLTVDGTGTVQKVEPSPLRSRHSTMP